MLKRFKVENFKNFSSACELDFTKVRNYDFNNSLIKDGYINKVLLYGKNGSGKSNIGFALMDINLHLSDNQKNLYNYLMVLNGDTAMNYIVFEYEFDFFGDTVVYRYKKDGQLHLLEEEIIKNGEKVFEYDYQKNSFSSSLPEFTNFNTALLLNRNINNSIIKMVYGFSINLPENSVIRNIYEFANKMLWFRSVLDGFQFMGNMNQIEDIEQFIINQGNQGIAKFEKFLNDCGLKYSLTIDTLGQKRKVMAKFKNRSYPLFDIASTGTKSLWLFYYWMERCEKTLSFLFLDEFDAFYHSSLSKKILDFVLRNNNFQSIITTHNTYLADNSIMRPDCYWIIQDGVVKSFADRTNRTIREGNNLEKMYLSEEFK